MQLIDTNVLVYLMVQGDQTPRARELFEADSDWRSEDFLMVEFSNVVSTFVRQKLLSPNRATQIFVSADELVGRRVNVPHARALEIALMHGVSAYDARFLGAADMLGVRLVTEDEKLRAAAPRLTQSIDEAL